MDDELQKEIDEIYKYRSNLFRKEKRMKLNDKIYKILKWGLIIFIPALITLIGTLGQIYNFETETIVLTISAISTFLGVITGISNYNYHKEND